VLNACVVFGLCSCTAAFAAMLWLGWLMRRHVRRRLTGVGGRERLALKLQAQLTRTLSIQVCSDQQASIYPFLKKGFGRNLDLFVILLRL
jgi:hypothetical protein